MKQAIKTTKGMAAVGPYSQAIKCGNLLFCSGNIGIDPKSNKFVEGGIKEQTTQVLSNMKAVLEAAAFTLDDVVKTTVYLKDMDDFAAMNEIYASFFKEPYPARATVEVARLPKDALVEIECIAYVKNDSCCGGCCSEE